MVTPPPAGNVPLVMPVNGALLVHGRAVVTLYWLARSAADTVSRRDGIAQSAEVRSLLTALESAARQVRSSAVPASEFRRSVPEATCEPDDETDSREVARMLGCSTRYVRYRAVELGGRKRAGRWLFSRRQILEQRQGVS
ncbi:hypothetical protein ACQPYH_04175 [Kribbella sp. CA-245084]|uniref:hypothetical protein n=1 Tax=Kribbella sp. CA-245084 TaxID=3239940 RepID=UPI003D8E1530